MAGGLSFCTDSSMNELCQSQPMHIIHTSYWEVQVFVRFTLYFWECLPKCLVEIRSKGKGIQVLFGKKTNNKPTRTKTLQRSGLCFALSSLWKFVKNLNLSPVPWSLMFWYSRIWIQIVVVPVQTLTSWYLEDWSYSGFSLLSLGVTGRLCLKMEHCCSGMQAVIPPTIKDAEKGTWSAAPFLTCSAGGLQRLLPQALYHRQGAEAKETPAKLQRIPGGAWIIFWSERSWRRERGRYFFADLSSITNVPCKARNSNTD